MGGKTEAKSPCNCLFTQLWACSAESVRWEEKQKQNPHAIVPLPSCGPGQLNLSGGRINRGKIPCNCPFTQLWVWSAETFRKEKYPRNKGEGKTNWGNNNLVMLSYYPVLLKTHTFIFSWIEGDERYILRAFSKGVHCTMYIYSNIYMYILSVVFFIFPANATELSSCLCTNRTQLLQKRCKL